MFSLLAGPVCAQSGKPHFRDITAESGITFRHQSAPEKKFIVESMGGGVALFDFDNDGLVDIYFVNSLTVDTANQPRSAKSALYRNLGKGKFEDVAEKAGIAFPGWGIGACTADYNGCGGEISYPDDCAEVNGVVALQRIRWTKKPSSSELGLLLDGV